MVAIHIQNVSKRFEQPTGLFTAVDNVNLSIPSGALFFLLGPSGCGKTTLLRMIAGFSLPSDGHIRFDDQDMTFVPPYKRDTGMVFQSYALWPHMTIGDNVGFGLDVRKIKGQERSRRINQALELVQMAHLRDRKPNQLSGGQQQRVALARAVAFGPKCMLLDEPLSNLDAKLRLEMRAEIRRICKETGITAIYVTHDQKEALSMADGIAVMKLGVLQQQGTPSQLYRQPVNRFVADFIGESNFLPATLTHTNGKTLTVQTPAGTLTALHTQSSALSLTAKLLAAFRPEAIQLVPLDSTAPNTFPGTRLSSTYLGEIAEHLIQVADGTTIKVFELNPLAENAASPQVTLHIPPENVMIVNDS